MSEAPREMEPPAVDAQPRQSSLFGRMRRLFDAPSSGAPLALGSEPEQITSSVRIDWAQGPFQLIIGKTTLEFHPDSPANDAASGEPREWLVHGGAAYYSGLAGFLRVAQGESVVLGRADDTQSLIFGYTKAVAARHVEITNRNGALIIRPLDPERRCAVSNLPEDPSGQSVHGNRRRNLDRIFELLGCPPGVLDGDEALKLIGKVNGILAEEPFRERDHDGRPGGVLTLPSGLTPLIVGDIHARIDNLLAVIVEGGFINALERNEACLILLGDLVHSQEPGDLEEMTSSVQILDFFLRLKQRFPANVFYLRGNHESFSPDVGKGGVAQGILFKKHLVETRGKAFVAEVDNLFEALPFIVQGAKFAACHGAPTRSHVSRETLINIKRYPGIQYEIVWNRLRQGNRPSGYTKGSVKRFRRALGLPKQAPVIVGHTPLTERETIWLNVNEIVGHHVVYSAHVHCVAAIMIVDGTAVPLTYVPEPRLELAEANTVPV